MHRQRSRLERRVRRLRAENADTILPAADGLIGKLLGHGFLLVDKASTDMPLSSHELRFERTHTDAAFAYVLIIFSDDGDLGFAARFGVRDYAPPHEWHCTANLARRRIGIRKSCNLGAEWFTPWKLWKFWKDWRFLEANVDAIVRFLETGKPNRHMVNVHVLERFSPKTA